MRQFDSAAKQIAKFVTGELHQAGYAVVPKRTEEN